MVVAYYIGIDPGKSGATVLMDGRGRVVSVLKHTATDADMVSWWNEHVDELVDVCGVIEKVHSMPGQGVASSFKFGMSYGGLRMLLSAYSVPFKDVPPGVWQRKMSCLTKGDKNVTKRKAQEVLGSRFDGTVIHANADALLLAEYARTEAWK